MTFLAPLFLLATLAGAIPVVLHLIHRRQTREVPFPTLRFLKLSVERTRRRRYVDDLALLLTRVGILVLLALGLAGPTLSALRGLLGRGTSTAVAIVWDNSGSMDMIDDGRPRIESARRAVEQVLDSLRDGDSAALLPTNGPIEPGHGRLLRTLDTVRQEVVDLKAFPEKAGLIAKVAEARALLDHAATARRELIVVTDNQAIAWEGREGAAGSSWPTVVVDVHGEPKLNVALRDFQVEAPAPLADVPVTARVDVFNPGAVSRSVHVELLQDGVRAAVSPTLELPPGGSVPHEFRFSWDRPGVHRAEARLVEEDGSALDNHIYFAQVIEQQLNVAIVQQRNDDQGFGSAAFYLERALSLEGAIHLSMWGPAELAREALAGQAVIYLVDMPALEPPVCDRLVEYVRGGGHLFWIMGKQVKGEAYERMNIMARGELLPVPMEDARRPSERPGESWSLADLDREHPALAPLTDPPSLYRSVLVYEVFPQKFEAKSGGRVLIRLDDGSPLLTERPVGAGSVLLLGTGLHVSWTNLPVRPLFLPLMARLTFHLAGVQAEKARCLAGAPMTVPIGKGTSEVEIVRPTGEVVRVRREKEEDPTIRYDETHDAGIYVARPLGPTSRAFAFAVNGDPDESSPEVLPAESLREKLGVGPLVVCRPAEVAETIKHLREGTTLAPWVLACVLALIVVETYLANERGRPVDVPTVDLKREVDEAPAEALQLLETISRPRTS